MYANNTPALPQYPRSYAVQLSAANTNYTAPTNTALLWVAGPDGSDVEGISAAANANQGSANQAQFFLSPDGGTTFNVLSLSAALASGNIGQTTALQSANFNLPSGVPMGPSAPLRLAGVPSGFVRTLTQGALTDSALYYRGLLPTQGTVNAQVLAAVYNAAGTQLSATPATGTIVDLIAGLTNTSAATIQLGAAGSGVALKRSVGALANLSAGDLTANFPYRLIFDGTEWCVLITTRLYAAIGQAQGVTVTAWGRDY